MKNLIRSGWILILSILFCFSCDDSNEPGPKIIAMTDSLDQYNNVIRNSTTLVGDAWISNITDISGTWLASKIEYVIDEITLDVTEYFDELEISINCDQSCCNINGCNSLVTSCDWANSENCMYNYFANEDNSNVLFFKIIGLTGSKMFAEIENKTPEFKLFPDEDREGIYKITLVAI